MAPATRMGNRSLRRARGLSLVELLVGLVVGLFVAAGASALAARQLADTRRLLLETQLHQDLRAALDIVTRDIRRSGHHGRAHLRVRPDAAAAAAASVDVYAPAQVTAPGTLRHGYSRDPEHERAENNTLDSDEATGFRWQRAAGVLQVSMGGGGYQDLTDREVVRITGFELRAIDQAIELPCAGPGPCVGASGCSPRAQVVRTIHIELAGQARHDPSVRRSVGTAVRLRNDALSCL